MERSQPAACTEQDQPEAMKNKKLKLELNKEETDYLHLAIKLVVCREVPLEDTSLKGAQLCLNSFFREKMETLYHPANLNRFNLNPWEAWALYQVVDRFEHKQNEQWMHMIQGKLIYQLDEYLGDLQVEFPMPDQLHLQPKEVRQLKDSIENRFLLQNRP